MALANKLIHNPHTGQSIRFIRTRKDTNGALLEMETTYQPNSVKPAPHFHPHQVEDFEVLAGEVTVELDGQRKTLRPGDTLHIPANTTHIMWNAGQEKAIMNWKVQPALRTEYLLETAMGLAADGKTNPSGRPNLLQTVLLLSGYTSEYRITNPPRAAQLVLIGLLQPLAWLMGYRSSYKKYSD
jgi:quercetin dioxygenase-like cupin family protein